MVNILDKIPKDFSQITYSQATSLLEGRRAKCGDSLRKFLDGDHWQGGEGFIGQKPPATDPNAGAIMLDIERGFQCENVLAEIVGRHVDGVLGREPGWDFIPGASQEPRRVRARTLKRLRQAQTPAEAPQPEERVVQAMEATDASLVTWWDDHDLLLTLQKGAETALTEEVAVLRLYITGERDAEGNLESAGTLDEAFLLLRLEVVTADKAGVFTHPRTGKQFTVYRFDLDGEKFVELSYLDEMGDTVLRGLNSADRVVSEAAPALKLGGRLMLCELRRRPLITDPVVRNQKALNLAKTMMMRNVNMAGSRERWFFNTQPPGEWVADPHAEGGQRWVPRPLKVGAGTSNFPLGKEIRDEQTGELKGYANPNLQVLEPVEVTSFTETRADFYASMLGQTGQRYALISGDATASGKSRIEARAEFEKSLTKTKTPLDAAGRWLIATARDLAADLAGQAGAYLDFRAEFTCVIDTGPADPEEIAANTGQVEAGLLSRETAMLRNGVDDTDAEAKRIEQDREAADARAAKTQQKDPANPQDPPPSS